MIGIRLRRLRPTLGGMLIPAAPIAVEIASTRPDVTRFVDVKPGTGPPVEIGGVMVVHDVGTVAGGKGFDSPKGRSPPIGFPWAGAR